MVIGIGVAGVAPSEYMPTIGGVYVGVPGVATTCEKPKTIEYV